MMKCRFFPLFEKKGPSQKTQREAGYTPKEIALLSGFILQIDFYPPFFWHSVLYSVKIYALITAN